MPSNLDPHRVRTAMRNPAYDTAARWGRASYEEGDRAAEDRNRYVDLLNNGQAAFEQSARAAVESAMPAFRQQLQGVRESAVRRGISTGDLGTSYEGDLASAFDANMKHAISGEALGLYGAKLGAAGGLYDMEHNNYLDMLSGQLDRETASKNADRQRHSSLWGSALSGLGSIAGAAILA